jgi:putative transposase
MIKAFKFQIKTSDKVKQKLEQTLDLCRELYNAGLQERTDAYKCKRKSISYLQQANQLPEITQDRKDLKGVHSQVLQDVLSRLDKGFKSFFLRIEKGQKPGYPRFKGKYRYNSFSYPGSGWQLIGDKLKLSKIGTMRVAFTRPIEGKVKTITIKRELNFFYAIFNCEIEEKAQVSQDKLLKVKAIDAGIEHFITDEEGKIVPNPQYYRKLEGRIKFLQRKLSRCKPFSRHWKTIKKQLAKLHRKVANQRRDFLHKQANKLVDNADVIVYENLNIAAMVQNHHLAKSISDVSWGMFFSMLDYKAENAGKLTVDICPKNTSQDCSNCKKKVPKGLSQRWHKCMYCGTVLHRDHNAAINILAKGIETLLADGLAVIAPGGLALAGSVKGEPENPPSKKRQVAQPLG